MLVLPSDDNRPDPSYTEEPSFDSNRLNSSMGEPPSPATSATNLFRNASTASSDTGSEHRGLREFFSNPLHHTVTFLEEEDADWTPIKVAVADDVTRDIASNQKDIYQWAAVCENQRGSVPLLSLARSCC